MWLTSRQLFNTLLFFGPRKGVPICRVAGGDVFECGKGEDCTIRIWVADLKVIVAYPNSDPSAEGVDVTFEKWAGELRENPLELGCVRDQSSYGAIWDGNERHPPTIKWAQAGDWAALARRCFIAQ